MTGGEDRAEGARGSKPDLDRAKASRDRVAAELMRYPNVVGLGVGLKVTGGELTPAVSIRVYVSQKVNEGELAPAEVLPKHVDGVPTDVIEDRFSIHQEHSRRRAILCGGISIGNSATGGSGTLGVSVFDEEGDQQLLLSNWHVLCGRAICGLDEVIIQPGTGGGDTGGRGDIVARLTRSVLTSVVDAAVARVTGHRMLSDRILGIGRATGTATAILGERARKSGRTTGVTSAVVADVDAELDVEYRDGVLIFNTRLSSRARMPASRDSGSVWLSDWNEVIGLNFAGGNFGDRAIANPIAAVVNELKIRFGKGVLTQDHLLVAAALD